MNKTMMEMENKLSTSQVAGKSATGLLIGFALAIIIIIALFATSYEYLGGQRAEKEANLSRLQFTIARTRAETIRTWLNGIIESSNRLAGSDIFRLFSSEMNDLPEGIPLLFSKPQSDLSAQGDDAEQLSSQIPLMQNLLTEFVRYGVDFQGARIMTSHGESYLATEQMDAVTAEQVELSKKVVETDSILYSPIQMSSQGILLFDMYIPIYSSQEKKTAPVAILILKVNASSKLLEVLAPGDYKEQGLLLRLVQRTGSTYQTFIPEMQAFFPLSTFDINGQNELPFGLRKKYASEGNAYLYGYKVSYLDWWIIAQHPEAYIGDSFKGMSNAVYAVTSLFSLVLLLCFLAAWWWIIGRRQGVINKKFQKLLRVIGNQKKLLDGINNSMTDPITLSDENGRFIYVNKAFASVVGRDEASCLGLDAPAVFGFDTAKRLNVSDQHVIMSGESIAINEVLWLQSKRYYYQISKVPLKEDGSRRAKGIVSVYRDITQLVEAEKRSHRVVQQTINALVSTIEEADPFLGGHSRIMGEMASLVSRQLALSDIDVATIEAAANLSQVGKIFVPREILLKPGSLTPEEMHEMERHVEYACNVLKDIEFDLPVLQAITEMNEHLDGKGYPKGLTADQICIHAKVLAVCNAFAAMARPRSYRPAIPINEVLELLEKNSGIMFDPAVVAALRVVLDSPAGERLVELAAMAKAV